jgi:hypothetical protein
MVGVFARDRGKSCSVNAGLDSARLEGALGPTRGIDIRSRPHCI